PTTGWNPWEEGFTRTPAGMKAFAICVDRGCIRTGERVDMQQDLLRIGTAVFADRTIVSLKGELDLSNSTTLIECFASVVRDRPAHLDVEMSELSYTDSVGLSVFMTTHFQCLDAGIPLRFINPNLF